MKTIKILFVCAGNSCRSPLAMALAQNHELSRKSLPSELYEFLFDSAAIRPLTKPSFKLSASVSSLAVKTIEFENIRPNPISTYKPKLLTISLVEQANIVVFLNQKDKNSAQKIFPAHAHKMIQLHCKGIDVIDPFDGQGLTGKPNEIAALAGTLPCYQIAAEQIKNQLDGLRVRCIKKFATPMPGSNPQAIFPTTDKNPPKTSSVKNNTSKSWASIVSNSTS